jgi:hypothetical protein
MDDDGSAVCATYSRATHWFVHHDAAQSFVLCLGSPQSSDSSGGSSGSDGGSSSSGGTSGSAAT